MMYFPKLIPLRYNNHAKRTKYDQFHVIPVWNFHFFFSLDSIGI